MLNPLRLQRIAGPHGKRCENGYTLLELLLYVAVIGVLLTAVTTFFGTTADARVKNQTIIEVNDQAAALMDSITQTIHNATSVTAPAVGTTGPGLTLAVPTGSLSPTVYSLTGTTFGSNVDGGTTDASDSNTINATKFVASATGTISTLYALVGAAVSASPNNVAQMAIYSGTSSPSTLLANSASITLTPSSWAAFSISPVSVTSGQTYWLAYNTNGLASTANDLRRQTGTTGQAMSLAQTYGTWPASWTGTSLALQYSVYAPIVVSGATSSVQIQEGAGSPVPLTNNNVQVGALTFKNLSRSGTPGSVQVSFVLSRVNPNGRNEYDYQRTFTATAEVGW